MARLEFILPPAGLAGKTYSLYRDWLGINFYKELCSYCLLQYEDALQIEHYDPQSYKPDRKNDPSNLLMGCPKCNSGKRDYHPLHIERKRLRKNNSGHSVIDIREEDFGQLFRLKDDGELLPRDGEHKEQVKFNIIELLRLDIPSFKKRRKKYFDYISACETLIGAKDAKAEWALQKILPLCAEIYLFIKAFDIPISKELRELVEVYLEENKPILVQ